MYKSCSLSQEPRTVTRKIDNAAFQMCEQSFRFGFLTSLRLQLLLNPFAGANVLESSPVVPETFWQSVDVPPTVAGGEFIVTLPISEDQQFFRLRQELPGAR